MSNNLKINRKLALSAVIATLYVTLTVAQELIFPGSASMAVQVRLSEALTALALFTPAAIPGLTVGCFVANLVSIGSLPTDIVIGPIASFLSAVAIYKLRNFTFKGLPLASMLMPVIFNGVFIGMEIEVFFIKGSFNFVSFLIQAGLVALGEGAACLILGILLYKAVKGRAPEKYLV